MSVLKNVIITARPRQWIKNLLVLAALFFHPELISTSVMAGICLTLIAFCFTSASVYCMNDVFDAERDRKHPEKRSRPVASGDLSAGMALFASAVFMGAGLGVGVALGKNVALVIGMYIAMNIAYTAYLKHVVIVDALIVSFGFVLRIAAGAEVIAASVSFWIVLCTVLATLFLTFSKRRHELEAMTNAADHRLSLAEYDTYFLDQMIAVVTAGTIISYALWTRDPETVGKFGTNRLDLTIPFVFYGIFRYLYIVHRKKLGGDPTKVFLTDKPLIINIVLWVVSVGLIIQL